MTLAQVSIKTAEVINNLHAQGIDSTVVLMRHSARIVDTAENDAAQELTAEGRRGSIAFGKALPAATRLCFHSSLINRCVETAVLIEEGYLSVHNGAATTPTVTNNALYAAFANDVAKMDKIAYAMMEKGEWAQFFRNWFNGAYPTEAIDPADQAAAGLLAFLIGLLDGETAVSHICASHDWHLFLIKEYYLHLRSEDHEFIQIVERYAKRLQASGGKLMLSGVSQNVYEQLARTETFETIPETAVFKAEDVLGGSTKKAMVATDAWLSERPLIEAKTEQLR